MIWGWYRKKKLDVDHSSKVTALATLQKALSRNDKMIQVIFSVFFSNPRFACNDTLICLAVGSYGRSISTWRRRYS